MAESRDQEIEIQRNYYKETAHKYNECHVHEQSGHFLALSFMLSALEYIGVSSILDVGSGTGRALLYLKQHRPDVRRTGIEPVQELREIGYCSGLAVNELIEGDATNIQFKDNEYDLVCAFGVLHHIKRSELAVGEMLRVSRKAIFISDANNFGQGSLLSRSLKQFIHFLGLWKIANSIKTKGKGYLLSEGDGLAYSYSLFNNYKQIKAACKNVHMLNISNSGVNLYRSASHIAILGIKEG